MYCILVVCYLLDYPCLYKGEGESGLRTDKQHPENIHEEERKWVEIWV